MRRRAGIVGHATGVGLMLPFAGVGWVGRKLFSWDEPVNPGKDNPFAKENGPLYPFFATWRWFWGLFGGKVEKKKEEKKG